MRRPELRDKRGGTNSHVFFVSATLHEPPKLGRDRHRSIVSFMKRKIPLFLRWIGILTIWLITSVNGYAQDLSLYVGESGDLLAPDIPGDGWIDKARWSTDNPCLELFNSDEFGTSLRINRYFEGTAKVECTYSYSVYISDKRPSVVGHATKTFRVRCLPNYATLSDEDLELNIGERHLLSYSLEDDNGIDGEWSSSNENVATVFDRGEGMAIVTAISPGRSRIKLDPIVGPVVYCDVEVVQSEPTSVTIPSSLTVYVGESSTLSATLTPYNATTTLTWYSKDTDVATVSSGKVTGVDEGSTIVYARTANGLTSNDCKVDVYYRKPTAIALDKASLTLPVGGSQQLKYSLTPSHAKASVEWSSTNPAVVSVSDDGILNALALGEASVIVTTDNGCVDTCTVKVLPLPVSLSLPQTLTLGFADSYKLEVRSYPAESYVEVEWISSNDSVVKVCTDGEVEGVSVGHATVTATASNGVSASCDVEVTASAYFLNLCLHDGSCFTYPFSQHPIIVADKDTTIVRTYTESIEYKTSDVYKYTLGKVESVVGEYNEMTSVEGVQANTPDLRMEQNCIVLSQCDPDMSVSMYSVSGQLIGTYQTDTNGYLAIPTNSLSKGIYIIKSKSITYKITRK